VPGPTLPRQGKKGSQRPRKQNTKTDQRVVGQGRPAQTVPRASALVAGHRKKNRVVPWRRPKELKGGSVKPSPEKVEQGRRIASRGKKPVGETVLRGVRWGEKAENRCETEAGV